MIKLKDLLDVCKPDWIDIGINRIYVKTDGISANLLEFPVKDITGWDGGLTIELHDGSSPCVDLPIPLETQLKSAIRRVFSYSIAGSGLHIVLSDENVEDHHIKWCIENSIPEIKNRRERIACEKCAYLLLKCPTKERERIVHGYGREWGVE